MLEKQREVLEKQREILEQFLYSSATVTGSTRDEECEELFPVNLLGGSRFLHLTALCFFPLHDAKGPSASSKQQRLKCVASPTSILLGVANACAKYDWSVYQNLSIFEW